MAEAGRGPIPPHHVYSTFLPEDEHRALVDWALASEALMRPSRLVYGKVDYTARSSRSLSLSKRVPSGDGESLPEEVKAWRDLLRLRVAALMPDLFVRAGMKPFPVSHIELELVAYRDGARFRPHRDTVRPGIERNADRLLTCVYYFYREPKAFSGGALRLYRFGALEAVPGGFVEIEPEQNSLLVFPSWSTHEVTPVSCPGKAFRDGRFAINCWLYRRREASGPAG